MNDKPHTHTPKITREYPYLVLSDKGAHLLEYGDTKVRICREKQKPTVRRVRRAFAKAVRKHDEGSQEAGSISALLQNLEYEHARRIAGGGWGGVDLEPAPVDKFHPELDAALPPPQTNTVQAEKDWVMVSGTGWGLQI